MRILSTSYSKTSSFDDPVKWLQRISFYTGILEQLAVQHEVISIERISYVGELVQKRVRYLFIKQEKEVERFPKRMHALIKEIAPDVVLVNGFIFPLQVIQLSVHIGPKPKILVLNRAEKPGRGLKKLLQQLADKAIYAYLFASAEDGKNWIKAGTIKDEKKIREVMQASSDLAGEPKAFAREKLGISGSPVFLWVGRLDKNKDPLTVIKAFIQYCKANPGATLYMIYQQDDLLNEIKERVEHYSMHKNIFLIGIVDHHMLGSWYSAADFIISGSHNEGSGIAILEAMSCGCIPIVTSIPSFKKMTANGSYGMLYEAGNQEQLVSLLLQTGDIDVAIEQKKVAEQFQNEFSFTAIAKKILDIIHEQ